MVFSKLTPFLFLIHKSMKTLFRNFFIFVLSFCYVFSGCGQHGKPNDFPKLYPCKITVTKDGSPVIDAVISLIPEKSVENITFVGSTDASGVAKMRSSQAVYIAEGVPEGIYKVLISKQPTLEHTKSESEREAMNPDELALYEDERQKKIAKLPKIVPPVLNTKDTTPLNITVTALGGELIAELTKY
jgi:hypothetical protein